MGVQELLTILIGGGGIGAIIAAVMTRQTAKDQNRIDLLDRAYKEIQRLEAKIAEAEAELEKEQEANDELRKVLFELKEQVSTLRIELKQLKGG
jgi:predicted RNase H-like nuclease (RuvC/YqgF family)